MTSLRGRKALDVVSDQTTLDRVARGVQTVLGIGYIDAVHAVQDTAERLGTQASAGQVLDAIGAAEAVSLVKVLEVDASRTQRTLEAAMPRTKGERVDVEGRVLLGLDADHGKLLGDPQETERRLARARRNDPAGSYVGDAGRAKFLADDRRGIEQGWDLPRSLERVSEEHAARAQAHSESAKVQRPLKATQTARVERRTLEQRVSDIDKAIERSEAEARDLRERGVVNPNAIPVGRLLEQRREAVKQLEAVQRQPEMQLDSIPGFAICADLPPTPAEKSLKLLTTREDTRRLQAEIDAAAAYRLENPEVDVLTSLEMAASGKLTLDRA